MYGGPAAGAGINLAGGRLINKFSPLGYTLDRSTFPVTPGGVSVPNVGQNLGFSGAGFSDGNMAQFQGRPQLPNFGTQGQDNMFADPGASPWGAFAPNLGLGAGRMANNAGAGTGYGAVNYVNDAWGETAAGFGVGAGNSGFGNRQVGGDIRGNVYAQ